MPKHIPEETHMPVERLLEDALRARDTETTRKLAEELHEGEAAGVFSRAPDEERAFFVEAAADILPPQALLYLEADALRSAAELLDDDTLYHAIDALETDEAVQVLEDLPEETRDRVLPELRDRRFAAQVEEGLAYPEDSVGRLMHRNFVHMPAFWTVGQAIDHLRERGAETRNMFHRLYLVDPYMRPRGSVAPSRILCSKRDLRLTDIADEDDMHTLRPEEDREAAAGLFRKYGAETVPVVNEGGFLIGEITADQIADVIDEEAHEDILKLGGVGHSDIYSNVRGAVKRRLPWLCVNLLTAVTAAFTVSLFEDAIRQATALAVLMPVIAAMAGNAGTQTLTVIVRAISTQDVSSSNALRIIRKEIQVGMINGLCLACIAGTAVMLIYQDITLGLLFGGALAGSLTAAAAAGTVIPIALEKAGADPAIASSVFLITVTDIAAFGLFLGAGAALLL